MSSVVVLGANGFLGSHLVDALVQGGHSVTAIDRFSGQRRFRETPKFVVQASFADVAGIQQVFSPGSRLIYAGGTLTPKSSIGSGRGGAEELRVWSSILQLFGQAMGERIYFCSSGGAIYGESPGAGSREVDPPQPLSVYGEVKKKSEELLHHFAEKFGFTPTVWRFGNLYGPRQTFKSGQGIIARVLECAQSGRPIEILGDGSMRRDYTFVEDATAACIAQLDSPGKHSTYNIGSGMSHSVHDVVREVENALNVKIDFFFAPQPPEFVSSSILDTSRLMGEYPSLYFRSLRDGLGELTTSH